MYVSPAAPRNLGEAWIRARQGIKKSQESMAAALGISDSYLSLIENNRRSPPIALLKKMAELTGWTLERLTPDAVAAVHVAAKAAAEVPKPKPEAFIVKPPRRGGGLSSLT